MTTNTRRAVEALTDELFALAVAIDLLQKQPPDCTTLLAKCESSIRRCQSLIASLRARSERGPPVTIQ